MKPITEEWVIKAEGDFRTMIRESRVQKGPNFDGVCFHAQQCAEKYIKARLVEAGAAFPKTHDLVALVDLVLPLEPGWEIFRTDFGFLAYYAVELRYPGDSSDQETALLAVERCRKFRQAARQALGLPE